MYYIYMVRCQGGSLYTGIAADLGRRLREHVQKAPTAAKYTRSRAVTALEAAWTAPDRSAASRLESAIKRLNREQKLRLIAEPALLPALLPQLNDDYTPLPRLSLAEWVKGERE